jgi:hypothetical protein
MLATTGQPPINHSLGLGAATSWLDGVVLSRVQKLEPAERATARGSESVGRFAGSGGLRCIKPGVSLRSTPGSTLAGASRAGVCGVAMTDGVNRHDRILVHRLD